jgi:hypothetical protein
MSGIGIGELVILAVLFVPALLGFIGTWAMFRKAGYPGALALLLLVPVAGWILLFWFGSADWPVLQRLRGLEQGRGPPAGFGNRPGGPGRFG